MLTARRLTTSHIWGPKHHEATGEGRRLWRQTSFLRRFCFFCLFFFPTDQHAVRASGGQGALFSLYIRIQDSVKSLVTWIGKHREVGVNLTRVVLFDISG